MPSIDKLLEIMSQLRNPESGCPWDLEQDFSTIAPYTIEEAYEVADAIAREDMAALRDELGDLLFQVVFYARMGEEGGHFDFESIAAAISAKMLRRHPHVFGSPEQRATGLKKGSWSAIKAAERADHDDDSAVAGVAQALPALKRAQKLGKRAARVGFDWPDRAGVQAKVLEELAELDQALAAADLQRVEEEFGDVLFALANLARHLDLDPEQALSAANRKFERRFRDMEAGLRRQGRALADCSPDELEQEWSAAKGRSG